MHNGIRTPPSFAIATLGCKVNQYDSLAMSRRLRALGFQQVPFHQRADAYIVDTCTVTAMADRKSRKIVGRAVRKNPHAVLAVTGCAVEWAPEAFQRIHPGCLIIGNREKDQLPYRLLEAMRDRETLTGCDGAPQAMSDEIQTGNGLCQIRAALKVQDGCNRICSYCIIPAVRGAPFSRPMNEVVREARELVSEGVRELVLTGVLLGAYGFEESWRRRGGRHPLAVLMERLDAIEGLARIRLSTIDPRDIHDEIIETMVALPSCCPHVHLPLQSGCDSVLKSMKRGYTSEQYAERVRRLRTAMAFMGITTDIMVGFPGETNANFEDSLSFAKEMEFSGIHVFPFSSRPGTAAEQLSDQVCAGEIHDRVGRMMNLAKELSASFAIRRLHSPVEILVEEMEPGSHAAIGMTPDYIRVSHRNGTTEVGDLITVEPRQWTGDRLID